MANKPKMNPQILNFLHTKLGKSIPTIRSNISRLKRNHHNATLNAVAQIYAEQHGLTVRRLISKEDKLTIPRVKFENVPTLRTKRRSVAREKDKEIIHFETKDHFLKKHIIEINKAYNRHCYTCVFVLTRKVLENLIIGVLKTKFPANSDLYFDKARRRYQDFSVVLDNLFRSRNNFDHDIREAIERLHEKLKPFKNDANKKVHSLYHIVEGAKEVDEWNLDTIMALMKKIT